MANRSLHENVTSSHTDFWSCLKPRKIVNAGKMLLPFNWFSLFFLSSYVRDATVAMIISFSLFVFPSERPRIFASDGSGESGKEMWNLWLVSVPLINCSATQIVGWFTIHCGDGTFEPIQSRLQSHFWGRCAQTRCRQYIPFQPPKKVASGDSPGFMDFVIGLMNSVFNMPQGQVKFWNISKKICLNS